MLWVLMRYTVTVVVMATAGVLSWSYLANLTLEDNVDFIRDVVEYAADPSRDAQQVLYEDVPEDAKKRRGFGSQSLVTNGAMTKPGSGEHLNKSTKAPKDVEDSKSSENKNNDKKDEIGNEASLRHLDDQTSNIALYETQVLTDSGNLFNQTSMPSNSNTDAVSRPQIAIVIDDMGLEPNVSRRMVALPRPLTMAWLPYGDHAPELAAEAYDNGHEILIHAPMEPKNIKRHDPGPLALSVADDKGKIRSTLNSMFARFENYAGINNHMGSRFTENKRSMAVVANLLRERGLIFLDSVTSSHSVAGRVVANAGVSTVKRDLFIDVDRSRAAIDRQLAYTEKHARLHGRVVAIGHPGLTTFQALSDWLPTLKAKGFDLVPVSAFASHPKQLALQAGSDGQAHLLLALDNQK